MNGNKKGFTLTELLVVVLIIVILTAFATQQYNKAVERTRLQEVVAMMSQVVNAQQRRYMNVNRYTENFGVLDTSFRGANGSTFYTKGIPASGEGGNGFQVTLSGTGWNDGMVVAVRTTADGGIATIPFSYQAERYYVNEATACRSTPGASEFAAFNGAALCADFCGIDWLEIGNWCCDDGTSENGGSAEPGGRCKVPTSPPSGM